MTINALPCLLLPMQEKNLILPSAAIAEIISFEKTKPIPDVPKWLIGILSWRGIHIPLTHLDQMGSPTAWNGPKEIKAVEPSQKLYIAIINRIQKFQGNDAEKGNQYSFLSIALKSVPKLYYISE